MASSIETNPLTPKQELFCQRAAVMSYADAYRESYDVKPGAVISADVQKLRRDPRIALRIEQIIAETVQPLKVTREWLLQWWLNRATYDAAIISAWAVGACRYCHGEGNQFQWRVHEYLKAVEDAERAKLPLPDIGGGFGYNARAAVNPHCPHCDGLGVGRENFTDTSELPPRERCAFDGIKRTKDGIEIKLADRDTAAKEFAKLAGYDVVQVKLLSDDMPEPDHLAALASDPIAIAAAYKRMIGTTH